jgi:hypothetical protein
MRIAIALVAVLFAGCAGSASTGTVEPADLTTEHVLDTDSTGAALAFDRLVRWVARTYLSAGAVTQVQDREAGALVWRYRTTATPLGLVGPYPYLVTVEMDIRDGRARWRQTFAPDPVRQMVVSPRALRELTAQADAARASALAAMVQDDDF